MSVNNRTRNSKRTLRIIRLEIEQSETVFEDAQACEAAAAPDRFRDLIEEAALFVSPEEFDAVMDHVESIGVEVRFRWDLPAPSRRTLSQRIQLR